MKDSEFMVCSRSGDILKVRVTISSHSLDAIVEKTESLSKSNGSAYHGFAVSKNRCFFAVPYW